MTVVESLISISIPNTDTDPNPTKQARQVLMMGFAAQVYNQVPCSKMRARLAQRLYDVCPEVGLDKGYRYLSV
jgi:hypothetical protein